MANSTFNGSTLRAFRQAAASRCQYSISKLDSSGEIVKTFTFEDAMFT